MGGVGAEALEVEVGVAAFLDDGEEGGVDLADGFAGGGDVVGGLDDGGGGDYVVGDADFGAGAGIGADGLDRDAVAEDGT